MGVYLVGETEVVGALVTLLLIILLAPCMDVYDITVVERVYSPVAIFRPPFYEFSVSAFEIPLWQLIAGV